MASSSTDHHRRHHNYAVSKPNISKWFANKGLKLSFHRRRSKSNSSSSSSSSSSTLTSSPIILTPSRSSNNINNNNNTSKAVIISSINSREDELREVFRHFDGNGDGKISALELRSYFGSIGENLSHDEAQAVIRDFDGDGDDLLDFNDFLKLMKKDHDHDLKNAFHMFELEKNCITPRSLQRMLGRLGDHSKSYDDCAAMIRVFDTDGNGVLDFSEFHHMMTA